MENTSKLVKRITIAMVFVLSIFFLVTFLPDNIVSTSAVTSSDIKAQQDKINQNKNTIAANEKKITALKKNISNMQTLKVELDKQIAAIQENIDDMNTLIEQYEDMISVKSDEIDKAQYELGLKYDILRDYLRVSYEDGGTSNFLSAVLESSSFADMLSGVERVSNLVDYQQSLMNQIDTQSKDLTEMKLSLEEAEAAASDLRVEMKNSEKDLQKKYDECIDLQKIYQNNMSSLQKVTQDLVNANSELDKELKQMQEEYAKQNGNQPYVGGDYMWPVSTSFKRISSPYGWRNLWGVKDFHLGIDIPAYLNSDIYAANSGTVITAKYHKSYGNYVVIDHGGGYWTLYAHANKLLVKVGDKVTKGQVIAKVGTTGNSSGYHCHFETRVNGVTKNPIEQTQGIWVYNPGMYIK